ncbi:MAG: VOC family protein [Verrucomicrobiota bacterium]|nr:VOC family protein [Verrucomicrobiota bacterium]
MHQSLPKTIDYVELPSRDLAASKRFFTDLFGWSFQDYGPEYVAFDDGRTTGGFFASEQIWNAASAAPLIVFYSPELEQILAEVERLGGEVTRTIFEFPGGRRFHFAAPGTGEFAIWSDK